MFLYQHVVCQRHPLLLDLGLAPFQDELSYRFQVRLPVQKQKSGSVTERHDAEGSPIPLPCAEVGK